MSYHDLRSYLAVLGKEEELVKIETEVDAHLEITEIVTRVREKGGPALWFNNVKGSPYPLVINMFGSEKRRNIALGVKDINEVLNEAKDLMDPLYRPGKGFMDKLKHLPQLLHMGKFMPQAARRAVCQEVVEKEIDLTALPFLQHWPGEEKPANTLGLIITKNLETGRQHTAVCPVQVLDEKTALVCFQPQQKPFALWKEYAAKGEKMPVAVILGIDPATIIAAFLPFPFDLDETLFAGFLRQSPLEVTRGLTVDLDIPANAEFVLEGHLHPGEKTSPTTPAVHNGYPLESFGGAYPLLRLKCITRKKFPLCPALYYGRPPDEDFLLIKTVAQIHRPFLQMILPEIVDLALVPEGGVHGCVVVSIHKQYPGQARKVLHALWGLEHWMMSKLIIIVDRDVPPHDFSAVARRVITALDPKRDMVLIEGPHSLREHAWPAYSFGWKLGIDATEKGQAEGQYSRWQSEVCMNEEMVAYVTNRWKSYRIE